MNAIGCPILHFNMFVKRDAAIVAKVDGTEFEPGEEVDTNDD